MIPQANPTNYTNHQTKETRTPPGEHDPRSVRPQKQIRGEARSYPSRSPNPRSKNETDGIREGERGMGKRAALLVLTFLFPGEERRRGAHEGGVEARGG